MKKIPIILLIFCLTGLAVYNNLMPASSPEQSPRVGFSAPHFELTGLDGSTYVVAGKREKPLVLNFWASWCGPCRIEAPDLREVYQKYEGEIDLYAVNMTATDSIDKATAFVEAFQLSFPIPLDADGDVSKRYQIFSIPTTFFIDRSGVIRYKINGIADRLTMEKNVEALLR